MADQEQVERLKTGVAGWNEWRVENPDATVDLAQADLHGTYLSYASLSEANLIEANLRGANLRRASLIGADLEGAELHEGNLSGVDLSGANLRGTLLIRAILLRTSARGAVFAGADLTGAVLSHADLRETDLRRAGLSEANFSKAHLGNAELLAARLNGTALVDVDMESVKGLRGVDHRGPSTIDHQTLAKSQGQIPEVFLRGCGFQDWEIEAAKLHNLNLSRHEVTDIGYRVIDLKSRAPIQINPVFLSYSRDDSAFVEAVEPLLDKKGIRYWRDVHHATAGPLDEQIERAIRLNPTYLLVLSEHSIESDWVEWEAQKARDLEKELRRQGDHRHVLCPVALDDSWKHADWPGHLKHQIEKYNILDFSQWRDGKALGGMFGRLLDGLGIYYRSDSA